MSRLINSRINPVKLLWCSKNVTKISQGGRVIQKLTKSKVSVENSGEILRDPRWALKVANKSSKIHKASQKCHKNISSWNVFFTKETGKFVMRK